MTALHEVPSPPDDDVDRSAVEILRRRLDGTNTIDEWGLDPDLVALIEPFVRVRWDIRVEGAERIPRSGPVVLVVNRHLLSEPYVVAQGIRQATGRIVRFLGVPDVAPVGPALRRLGGAIGSAEELGGLLRAGNVVVVALDRTPRTRRRAGFLAPGAMTPVLGERATVLPVAAIGHEWGRGWRIVVGEPLSLPPGRSPLAVAELADEARTAVQELLDEAFPPRWPFG